MMNHYLTSNLFQQAWWTLGFGYFFRITYRIASLTQHQKKDNKQKEEKFHMVRIVALYFLTSEEEGFK